MTKSVRLGTTFSKAIKIKAKNFLLFLRRQDLVEVNALGFTWHYEVQNDENEMVFEYTDEQLWEDLKAAKKAAKKIKGN
jgi:hypothetical protein